MLGGVYTLPTHLSEGARDLIPKMLVVSPNLRITIPEIRKHPWFIQDLPDYLAQPPEAFLTAQIDEEALAAVSKMGFEPDEVRAAVNNKEHNQLTVSYYLSLETIQRKAQRDAEAQAGPLPAESIPEVYVKSASPEGPFAMSEPENTTPSSSYTGPSFTERAVMLSKVPPDPSSPGESPGGLRWHFGAIRDDRPASVVLSSIYHALRAAGAVWRRTAAYALECKVSGMFGGRTQSVLFRVHVFSYVPSRHSGGQRESATRVVDMCCLSGDAMMFYHVCREFRSAYAQNG